MRTTSLSNRARQEATSRRRWFEEGELTCAWLPCGEPMPAGYYGRQKRVYHCSHSCSQECYYARMRHLKCRHCGKTFVPRKSNSGRPFCSRDHASAWRQSQADKDRFGRFAPLVKEFLEDSKSRLLSRSSLKYLRSNLAAFFEFIPSKRIRSLENVRSSHITEFMEDRKLKAPKSGGRAAIDLHVFFDWMEKTKRRRAINPVIRRFHGWKPPRREPRPYTRMELARIRSWWKTTCNSNWRSRLAPSRACGFQKLAICGWRTLISSVSAFSSVCRLKRALSDSCLFIQGRDQRCRRGSKYGRLQTMTSCLSGATIGRCGHTPSVST